MSDIEKTIRVLETMLMTVHTSLSETERDAIRTATELLKEQEAKRKTAHWVFGNAMGHSYMKCSECCVSQSGQTGCWTYCPNCGAEMKGDTEVEIN